MEIRSESLKTGRLLNIKRNIVSVCVVDWTCGRPDDIRVCRGENVVKSVRPVSAKVINCRDGAANCVDVQLADSEGRRLEITWVAVNDSVLGRRRYEKLTTQVSVPGADAPLSTGILTDPDPPQGKRSLR
jgi:hypothetical protein